MLYKFHKIQLTLFLSAFVTIFFPSSAIATGPDVKLMRIDGIEQHMTDYIGQGKWVIVNVWSPSCSFCVQELPHVEKFERKHRGEIIVLGITLDFPSFGYGKVDIIKAFLQRHPLNYPIFLADLDSASNTIGNRLTGIPTIAIYHPDGRALARWPGYININEIEEFMQNYTDYLSEDELSRDF